MSHPPDAVLVEDPPMPDVTRHLMACPRCRVHRRLLCEAAVADAVESQDGERWSEEADLEADPLGQRSHVWDGQLARRFVRVRPPEGSSAVFFRHAASVIRSLGHPHLAQVHFVDDGPPLTYLRDLVAGDHLGDHDVAGDGRAVAWLAQCASALAVLHQHGLVHGCLVDEAVRITPGGKVVLVGVGTDASATPDDDWRALATLFSDLPAPAGDVVEQLSSGGHEAGVRLLAWLLAVRDPGAGGRFEQRGLLGIGGMGEVRRVYDPLLERIVAQKVLSGSLLEKPEHIAGFLAEAKITAQLQHPGIVPVHDLEIMPNGAVAFTMKQIEGRTLAEVIREVHAASPNRWNESPSGWSLRRLVNALLAVCDAIAYAHDQGVVHLDLKPANVMVGDYGEVLVVDWGLARRMGAGADGLPQNGHGTPGFMAPEQGATTAEHVGPAADIYALGSCLRAILDGVGPPTGGTETDEVPGTARSRWVPQRANAPRELVSIARKATQADPMARYTSAKSLAADLTAWRDERWVEAHDYRWTEVWRRRLRPYQAPLVVLALALVVLGAVGAVGYTQNQLAVRSAEAFKAQALVDRANLAFEAGDRVGAEVNAAAAVEIADRADARGLLSRLVRTWRPELVGQRGEPCVGLTIASGGSDTPEVVVCATVNGTYGWSLDDPSAWAEAADPTWVNTGAVRGLRGGGPGAWMGLVNSTIVHGDVITGQVTHQILAQGDVVDAIRLTAQAVAVAVEDEVRIYDRTGARGPVVQLGGDILALAACGPDRLAVATTTGESHSGNDVWIVDLSGDSAPHSLGADRVDPPLACSPDGRLLAVASDRAVQVWNLDRSSQMHSLTGHLGPVLALAWAADGRTLASASSDATVRIWDAQRNTEVGRVPGHDRIQALALAPSGASLLTATAAGVRKWALPPIDHGRAIDAVVEVVDIRWARDAIGHTLFLADRQGRPLVFDAATGSQALEIDLGGLRIGGLDPDAQGARVALVTGSGDFRVLDLDEYAFVWVQATPPAHPGGGTAVAWKPGNDVVVSGGQAGDIRAWGPPVSGNTPANLWNAAGTGGGPVADLEWASHAGVVAARTGGTSGGVVLLDGSTGAQLQVFPSAPVLAHAVSPNGGEVALAWTAGGLSVGASPAAFRRLDVQGHVVGVSYSPSAPLLASITRAGLIQVFDTRTDRELARQFAHPGGATDIAFSLDGALLASSGPTGSIVLMDASVFAAARPGLEARTADRYGLPRPTEQLESP